MNKCIKNPNKGFKNFLKFYFDTDVFTEEEAKAILKKNGADVDKIERKKVDFLNKSKAPN